MNTYRYEGPVFYFDDCIVRKYKAETQAVSAKKARSNFTYQWKMKNGYDARSAIRLPGKIVMVVERITGNQLTLNI